MPEETSYAKARKTFERLPVGERISSRDLADQVGAKTPQEKRSVSALLSQQAKKGTVTKHVGEDGKLYYEKVAPTEKPGRPKVAATKDIGPKDTITLGEIGEGIFKHMLQLNDQVAELLKERDEATKELSVCHRQKEAFERLYKEASEKIEELSSRQPRELRTVKLSEVLGEE
jgi:hypothetical protein